MGMRVGLAGLGYWGSKLRRNLLELGVDLLTCDVSEPADFRDFAGMVEAGPQAVIIATPAVTHHALAVQALKAGLDVLVEKPLALSSQHTRELCQRAGDRVLMAGHTHLYSPAVLKAAELLPSLGKLELYRSVRHNRGTVQADVDVIWDLAVHDLAILDYLELLPVGGRVVSRRAHTAARIALDCPRGLKAEIELDWLADDKLRRIELRGTQGELVYDERELLLNGTPVEVGGPEPLRAELEHFLECVRTRSRPRSDGKSALRISLVLEGL